MITTQGSSPLTAQGGGPTARSYSWTATQLARSIPNGKKRKSQAGDLEIGQGPWMHSDLEQWLEQSVARHKSGLQEQLDQVANGYETLD